MTNKKKSSSAASSNGPPPPPPGGPIPSATYTYTVNWTLDGNSRRVVGTTCNFEYPTDAALGSCGEPYVDDFIKRSKAVQFPLGTKCTERGFHKQMTAETSDLQKLVKDLPTRVTIGGMMCELSDKVDNGERWVTKVSCEVSVDIGSSVGVKPVKRR